MAKRNPQIGIVAQAAHSSDIDLNLDLGDMSDLSIDLDIDLGEIEPEAPEPAVADLMAGYAYTGNAEKDSAAEMSAVLRGFKERAKAEGLRRKKATESGYWLCLCFQSQEQVDEFLRNSKWGNTRYLDGQKVAKKLGVEITPETPVSGRVTIDAKLANLAMEI